MAKKIDTTALIGKRFDALVVLASAPARKRYDARGVITASTPLWTCRCDCGVILDVQNRVLVSDKIKHKVCRVCFGRRMGKLNAGCHSTHGLSKTRVYGIWYNMLGRCYDPSTFKQSYAYYGAQGITVCERWRHGDAGLHNFIADMGEPPDGYTLERKECTGNYTPDNCIWIPRRDQARNTRASLRITANGRTLTAAEWADELGVSAQSLSHRKLRGLSDEATINTPFRRNKTPLIIDSVDGAAVLAAYESGRTAAGIALEFGIPKHQILAACSRARFVRKAGGSAP